VPGISVARKGIAAHGLPVARADHAPERRARAFGGRVLEDEVVSFISVSADHGRK
jgi:hypothetical protein